MCWRIISCIYRSTPWCIHTDLNFTYYWTWVVVLCIWTHGKELTEVAVRQIVLRRWTCLADFKRLSVSYLTSRKRQVVHSNINSSSSSFFFFLFFFFFFIGATTVPKLLQQLATDAPFHHYSSPSSYIQQHWGVPPDVFPSKPWSSHISLSIKFSIQYVLWYSMVSTKTTCPAICNPLNQRFPTFLNRAALFRINFYGGAP